MDLDQRIAQFENMAQADPENEMAHFSLASAYAQAERYVEAANSYIACTKANPDMSKAFQLAAENFAKAGKEEKAKEALLEGYEVAAKRGDLLPKRAMAEQMEKLGMEIPKVEGEDTTMEELEASGAFICQKTGRPGRQLDAPPFKGPEGEWIRENISAETWNEWIGQGTKVINELRLDLSKDEDAETYDRYMREFLGITDDVLAQKSND